MLRCLSCSAHVCRRHPSTASYETPIDQNFESRALIYHGQDAPALAAKSIFRSLRPSCEAASRLASKHRWRFRVQLGRFSMRTRSYAHCSSNVVFLKQTSWQHLVVQPTSRSNKSHQHQRLTMCLSDPSPVPWYHLQTRHYLNSQELL